MFSDEMFVLCKITNLRMDTTIQWDMVKPMYSDIKLL